MLGGVCGGIGSYLSVSPTLVRIVWAVLTVLSLMFFWVMILVYIALWVLIPEESDPMIIDAEFSIRE
jgi:phage shock protein C